MSGNGEACFSDEGVAELVSSVQTQLAAVYRSRQQERLMRIADQYLEASKAIRSVADGAPTEEVRKECLRAAEGLMECYRSWQSDWNLI